MVAEAVHSESGSDSEGEVHRTTNFRAESVPGRPCQLARVFWNENGGQALQGEQRQGDQDRSNRENGSGRDEGILRTLGYRSRHFLLSFPQESRNYGSESLTYVHEFRSCS